MSEILKYEDGDLVPLSDDKETIKVLMDHPLRALPSPVRNAVYAFYMQSFGQLDSTGEISFRIAGWLAQGLTEEDAVEVLKIMTRAAVMKNFETKPLLLAALARLVEDKMNARKAAKETAERARYAREYDRTVLTGWNGFEVLNRRRKTDGEAK